MYKNIIRAGKIPVGGPRIVVIGGGTGLSVILRGLKNLTDNITAIVTVTDDGGGSGVIRSELGMLPPGDIRNCILALADDEDIMEKLLQYRFHEGRLNGQNMGNLFIAALTDIYGDFELAVDKLQDILRIKGHVIPVTSQDEVLCAVLEDGTEVRGESTIPVEVKKHMSPIKRVFLDPDGAEALPSAIDAIMSADMIVLGPGSLYSSIIPNLLVKGISSAIRDASGIKSLICNVMTQAGETDDYTVSDCAHAVEQYLGKNVIDYMIINDHKCSNEELEPYITEGVRQILATDEDREELRHMGITPIESSMIEIGDGLIRHDASRIASIIVSLIHEG
ncbi:MAG: gluconeogenesis factor YvcK family protein [Anaerovoracaceae bacterium]|jgi:uncharacterized cofD-like protein